MKKEFKLSNLRELSTEEQLHLNGGMISEGCDTCSCTCPCIGEVNKTEGSKSDSKSYRASSEFT